MASTINGITIPNKPTGLGQEDFDNPVKIAEYQEGMQNYHFAVDMVMNSIKQEGEAKSNILKTINEGLEVHIRNLG